jgi:hypothetical protein
LPNLIIGQTSPPKAYQIKSRETLPSETTMLSPLTDLDKVCFEHVIFAWLGIPNDAAIGLCPLVRGLLGSGSTRWSNCLLLSAEHNCTLTYTNPPDLCQYPIPLNMKNMTMVALALFHHTSRKIGKPMDPTCVTSAQFNTFRVEEYNPVTPPSPLEDPQARR